MTDMKVKLSERQKTVIDKLSSTGLRIRYYTGTEIACYEAGTGHIHLQTFKSLLKKNLIKRCEITNLGEIEYYELAKSAL